MSDCRFGVSPVNYPDPDPDSAFIQFIPKFLAQIADSGLSCDSLCNDFAIRQMKIFPKLSLLRDSDGVNYYIILHCYRQYTINRYRISQKTIRTWIQNQ